MLAQQLRQLESNGILSRKLYPQVHPKVEFLAADGGQALSRSLDAMLKWPEQRHALLSAHDGDTPPESY
ncbi:winged helix-turn-helix transcriptional regulator [Zestomonas carbonaria]|uniref:winged helix-turn-helix transcriptional regulator n=1 Tax=Zestomonas carbonaria TaxID=2762745 RepID=UPI001656EE02|nr:winged helix-turn-helix transcriptional regulator [Pseudomonas carbonaria]